MLRRCISVARWLTEFQTPTGMILAGVNSNVVRIDFLQHALTGWSQLARVLDLRNRIYHDGQNYAA